MQAEETYSGYQRCYAKTFIQNREKAGARKKGTKTQEDLVPEETV